VRIEFFQKRTPFFMLVIVAVFLAGCASTKWCDCAKYEGPNLPDTPAGSAKAGSQASAPSLLVSR